MEKEEKKTFEQEREKNYFEFDPNRNFDERCEILRRTAVSKEMTYEERLAMQRARYGLRKRNHKHCFDMKKAIVIEKENGKRIAFVRQSDTVVLVLRILAALNIAACVFSTFNKHYIWALLDLAVSFFTYQISCNIERNNEIFDFFDDSENNLKQ